MKKEAMEIVKKTEMKEKSNIILERLKNFTSKPYSFIHKLQRLSQV